MKNNPYKIIALCLITLAVSFQLPAQIPSLSGKTPVVRVDDTVTVRLNNKLYYTVTNNDHWQVNGDGKVIFSPRNANDTLPEIGLDYIGSKPSLVKKLRKGDTIANCLVGEIKLSFSDFMDKTQKKNAVQNMCSRKLIFLNCVFSRVLADTVEDILGDDSKEKKKLNFTQDIQFINCNFSRGLELSNCIFNQKFILTGQVTDDSPSSIDNCEFRGICYIYSAPDYNKGSSWLKMSSCTFRAPCVLSIVDNNKSHITIERCKFNNVFSLGKSAPQELYKRFHATPNSSTNFAGRLYKYYTAYTDFLKNKFNKEYYVHNDSIQNFLPVNHIIYNLLIAHCKIKIMDIANASMMDCSLEDVAILQCIDVTNSTFNYSADFAGKQGLEDIDFPNMNGVMYASYKTFSPEAFKLNIYMQKIKIHPLVHNYFDSTSDFMQDNSNFYNMITDYAAKKITNQDMVTALKSRYNHEKAYWERSYNAAHIFHSSGAGDFLGSLMQWTLSWFLEITVSNGYQGEWKFAIWVLFIILFFTCFYYLRHKEAAIDYLNSKFNKEELDSYETLKVYKSFNGFRDFMRCLWFSCMVFVDPRLPISFFNLRSGLFGLVLTEWLCGLTAILLFLIFLASNYPFIHTLIGI